MIEYVGAAALTWLWWEFASLIVSKPVKDGEPIRGPLSVVEYLTYNPGVLVNRGEES